jgi:hypothetical protein
LLGTAAPVIVGQLARLLEPRDRIAGGSEAARRDAQ